MVPGMLDVKGTKILAKSLFKELRGNGYSANQILSLSTELIELVTQDIKGAHVASVAGEIRPAVAPELLEDRPKDDWRAAL